MSTGFQRSPYTWLAYCLLAFFGYLLNILGPVTPFLKEELGLSYTVSSLHYTAFALGILIIGFGGHLVIERLGRGRCLWLGAFGMALGVVLLLVGRSPLVTVGASLWMGLVGSLILTIVPSSLADLHGAQLAVAYAEANVISSIIATAAPLLVGLAAGWQPLGGWRWAVGIAVIPPLLLWVGFRRVEPPPSAAPAREPGAEKRALPGLFWVYWFAIVLAVAQEFCMISWSADYMEKSLGMDRAQAAQSVSLFFVGMIVGRLGGSRLVQRFASRQLALASLAVAGLGFLIFWLGGTVATGLIGLLITGLGVASLYPLIVSLAIGAAGSQTVRASARTTLASGTAILALPLVLGRLADAVGIHQAYGVMLLLVVGVVLILLFAGRLVATQPAVVKQ